MGTIMNFIQRLHGGSDYFWVARFIKYSLTKCESKILCNGRDSWGREGHMLLGQNELIVYMPKSNFWLLTRNTCLVLANFCQPANYLIMILSLEVYLVRFLFENVLLFFQSEIMSENVHSSANMIATYIWYLCEPVGVFVPQLKVKLGYYVSNYSSLYVGFVKLQYIFL